MLTKLRSNKGFTLIELLIVVAIIGILAAVAIPQFSKYRIQGYNASGNSDMRNIRTSEESFFAEWQRYGRTEVAALPGAGGFGAGAKCTGPGVAATPNIITVTDNVATNRGLQIPVGNNVDAFVSTSADPGAAFSLVVKHLQGDAMFAANSESTANYKLPYSTALGKAAGAPIVIGDVITPVVGTDVYATAAAIALGWKTM